MDINTDQVLINVLKKFNEEKEEESLQIPLNDYLGRASNYTGVSKENLLKLTSPLKTKSINPVNWMIQIEDLIILLNYLHQVYTERKTFDLQELYMKLSLKDSFSLDDFYNEIVSLGYAYKKTLNNSTIILEDPNVTFERFNYLNKIKKLRGTRYNSIYYIDERIISQNSFFEKPWTDSVNNLDTTKFEWLFVHVISINGLKKAIFCSHFNNELFIEWVTNVLLPILEPESVIVMDNNPLHGTVSNTTITKYHSKKFMMKWLTDNQIPHSKDMHKAQLFSLINNFKCKKNQHPSIDHILKASGHEVLRIPDSLVSLNPTFLLWKHLQLEQSILYKDSFTETKDNIFTLLKRIKKEKWSDFMKSIASIENKILNIDTDIDATLEMLYGDIIIP